MKDSKTIDVCLVGHDVQPSMAFTALVSELSSRGLRVLLAVMNGKEYPTLQSEVISLSRFVLIGMSSLDNAVSEIEAATMANKLGVPFGFYAGETFLCYRRSWFSSFWETASLVFAFNQSEVNEAQRYFPNAKIVPTGNPTHASYFTFDSKIDVERKLGLSPKHFVVFVGGGGSLQINQELLAATVYACGDIPEVRIIFGLHPGDKNPVEKYREYTKDFAVPVTMTTRSIVSGSSVLSRANLLITSATSLGIEAACKRVPVINFLTTLGCDSLEQVTGGRVWPPCKHGVSMKVEDPISLRKVIQEKSYEKLRQRQEEVYPAPTEPGKSASLSLMADAVCSFVNK